LHAQRFNGFTYRRQPLTRKRHITAKALFPKKIHASKKSKHTGIGVLKTRKTKKRRGGVMPAPLQGHRRSSGSFYGKGAAACHAAP